MSHCHPEFVLWISEAGCEATQIMDQRMKSLRTMVRTLPEGREGRLLALGMLAIGLMLAWLLVLGPLWDWYAVRAQALDLQRATVSRMDRLAASLPALRRAAAAASPGPSQLIGGATDAVASANLQDMLQQTATAMGANIASAENVSAAAAGRYRRIGLHVDVSAPFATLVQFIARLEHATPAIVIDGLHLRKSEDDGASSATMECDMVVYAFRRADGTPPQETP